jgi:hypothetical protein
MDALTISIEELNKAYDEACQWSVSSFPVVVAPDLTEDNVITINLIDTMDSLVTEGLLPLTLRLIFPNISFPRSIT